MRQVASKEQGTREDCAFAHLCTKMVISHIHVGEVWPMLKGVRPQVLYSCSGLGTITGDGHSGMAQRLSLGRGSNTRSRGAATPVITSRVVWTLPSLSQARRAHPWATKKRISSSPACNTVCALLRFRTQCMSRLLLDGLQQHSLPLGVV